MGNRFVEQDRSKSKIPRKGVAKKKGQFTAQGGEAIETAKRGGTNMI